MRNLCPLCSVSLKSAHCGFLCICSWITFYTDRGIPRALSRSSAILFQFSRRTCKWAEKGEYFRFWSFCLKKMGGTKWWRWWGEMSEVVGVEGPLAFLELHVPCPARLLSKAFLLKYCNNLNGKELSSLIWIFCAIKNLAFCPPWTWGEEKKLFIFLVHSSLLRLWNLLCLFFFKLNHPQSVLINSSTPAALLDRQSNEYCNKNLVYKKYSLWNKAGDTENKTRFWFCSSAIITLRSSSVIYRFLLCWCPRKDPPGFWKFYINTFFSSATSVWFPLPGFQLVTGFCPRLPQQICGKVRN